MPIYEFYCEPCHTVFSFLSSRVNTRKRPDCPGCGRRRLERRPSRFAIAAASRQQGDDEAVLPDVDPGRLEQGLAELAREAGAMAEEDPRRVAGMVRRLYESAGLPVGPGLEEAMRRMEAGEDPEAVEAELGDVLESEDPTDTTSAGALRRLRRRLRPPRVDDTLHRL